MLSQNTPQNRFTFENRTLNFYDVFTYFKVLYLTTLSASVFFKTICGIFDFVTQFLWNGSNKSFVYHFVENFKLFHEKYQFLL